jgi:pimeloyl-ACP methyl ester carboxylesterase
MRRESTSEGDHLRSLTVDGVDVRWSDRPATVASEASHRPLLLLNGLGANLEMWAPLTARLADRRVLSYDGPGTGGSGTSRRAASMSSLAAVASRVLDAAGVDTVDVLGYSFGGFLAQELARVDERVAALVLAATGAGWSSSITDLRELAGSSSLRMPLAFGVMLTPTRYYLRPEGQRVIRRIFGDGDRDADEFRVADEARAARPPSSLGYLYQLLAAGRWSSRAWLGELRMPTLVLSGERDTIATVAAGRYLADHVPNARHVVVPEAGHSFLLRDDPSGVVDVIRDFLDDQGRAAAA